jgi:hypothetical protein
MLRTNKERECGQSVLVIAIVIMILLALVAVVVDVGNAYAHRRMVQNAVDAATLAGARQLGERGMGTPPKAVLQIQVSNAINKFAEDNGLARDDVQAWFIDGAGNRVSAVHQLMAIVPVAAKGVEVQGNLPFETYFAHLIGFPTMTASTSAKAWVLRGPCSGSKLFPIGIDCSVISEDCQTGVKTDKTFTMWDKTKEAPGQFGWLYWVDGDGNVRGTEPPNQNSNTTNLRANIEDTSRSGDWRKGDWVHGSSGVSFNSVMDALQAQMTESNRTVIVPIYDTVAGTGDNQVYRIAGFGAFNLTCAYHGQNSYAEYPEGSGACDECKNDPEDRMCIKGEFVDWVEATGDDGCIDTGIAIPSFRKPTSP